MCAASRRQQTQSLTSAPPPCPADATVLVLVPTDNMALSPLVKPGTLKKSGVASGTTAAELKSRGGPVESPAPASFAMAFVVWVAMVTSSPAVPDLILAHRIVRQMSR